MQPGLPHQRKQPYGFQRNRLSSGIRPGDDQQRKILPQSHRDGHYLPGIQKGMPSVADVDPSLFVQNGTASVHGHGKLPSGKNKVQIRQAPVIGTDLFNISRGLLA